MLRRLRILVGLIAWSGGLAGTGWLVAAHFKPASPLRAHVAPQLWRYATRPRTPVVLDIADPLQLEPGDPIFLTTESSRLVQIGEIRHDSDTGVYNAMFYASAPMLSESAQLSWYSAPDSMAWITATLLPPEKQHAIQQEIAKAIQQHHEEIFASLQPLVERSLRASFSIVEAELPAAIERHRPEIEAIAQRYQHDLVEKDILPVVRSEIWPLVQDRAEPAVTDIGGDLWNRVSLWRFTWRYLYDKAPLSPRRDRVQREFRRFVAEEAVPVLEQHSDRIVKVVQQVISDAATNPRVRSLAGRTASKILDDPELRRLLWQIVRETAIDNPRFRQALRKTWTGPEAKHALLLAGERLEPTVRRIGDLLIGSRDEGITPEFAAVLRNQVLGKDRHWLMLEPGTPDTSRLSAPPRRLTVVRGGTPETHPFLARTRAAPPGEQLP